MKQLFIDLCLSLPFCLLIAFCAVVRQINSQLKKTGAVVLYQCTYSPSHVHYMGVSYSRYRADADVKNLPNQSLWCQDLICASRIIMSQLCSCCLCHCSPLEPLKQRLYNLFFYGWYVSVSRHLSLTVLLIAATEKAAADISGVTRHSEFSLPVKKRLGGSPTDGWFLL